MIKDGIYLGIDVIECWLCDELKVWFVKVFDWEVAWFFKFYDWEVYFFKDGQIVWFEELLDILYMGICWGLGVFINIEKGWCICYYDLALMVFNECMEVV